MTLTSLNNDTIMNDLKLRFGTNTNEIDANTFINSILHFSNIVQEVNKELKTNRKIEVKIKALQPGSFVVNIIIESGLIETIENLFTKENIEIASNLIGVIGGVFGAAKFLKGEKPKSIENNNGGVKIENVRGDVTVIDNRVYNIYKNPDIQQMLAKEFETLENDNEVQSFEILTPNDEAIVEFTREEFSEISNIEYVPAENSQIITKNAVLSIISLSFDKKKKWEFMFDGHKISAKIDDEVFYKLIDSGESFAKGDVLKASLEITQKYNELAKAYGNHSYKVVTIFEHTKGSDKSQLPMF